MSAAEIERVRASREKVQFPTETLLVTPDKGDEELADPKSGTKYRTVCFAYLRESGMWVRRFAVHAPDREGMPQARSAAKFMALLWSMADRRFGSLASRLRSGRLDIWLTRTGPAGGEQIGSNVYIYDIQAQRSPLEWARELAHEYGHFLLPGASGFSDPEDWSNGLLGERLFMRWLRADLRERVVEASSVPFVSMTEVADYCEKQSDALLERVRRRGPDLATLRRKDAACMDELSALLLHADATYGSKTLFNLLDYLPSTSIGSVKPESFYAAISGLITNARGFSTDIPAGSACKVFLPKGKFRVTPVGALDGLTVENAVVAPGSTVTITQAGWRSITAPGAGVQSLRWERL